MTHRSLYVISFPIWKTSLLLTVSRYSLTQYMQCFSEQAGAMIASGTHLLHQATTKLTPWDTRGKEQTPPILSGKILSSESSRVKAFSLTAEIPHRPACPKNSFKNRLGFSKNPSHDPFTTWMGTSIMLIQEQKTQSKSTPTLPPAYALAQEHWRHRTELMERQLQLQEAYTLLLPTGEGETAATKF